VTIDGTPKVGRVSGQVLRQHRSNHGGITVQVTNGTTTLTSTTDAFGNFSILAPLGTVSVSANLSGYLGIRRVGVSVSSGATATLPPRTLLVGEVTGDTCIDKADMTAILNAIGTSASPSDPRDVDGNRQIWYDDLGLASFKGGTCGPIGW